MMKLNIMISLFLVLLLVSDAHVSAQGSRCGEMKTCGQCMSAGGNCAWCSQPTFGSSSERCGNKTVLVLKGCQANNIVNPEGSVNLDKNRPPQNADRGQDPIQLSPQEITIIARPNDPIKFPATFRLAENYPVDLYFVMDLSVSMKDDKENLARLGNTLVSEMRKLTENFRVGFGSFVDKKAMPFVSTVPASLTRPCDGCAAPFGFHNILPITDDTAKFVEEVRNAEISGNLDNLEGGFDAIMQAVTCRSEIGWREQARKILLYSTDGGFHYAGDGKLAGIVIPNDQQCHLDTEGYYSESLTQDYPSISQLSQSITDNNINVIFAVTESELNSYQNLSVFIRGSTIGELAGDSSNIIELIRDNYHKISGSIEMRSDAGDDMSVTFRSKCLGTEEQSSQKSIRCDGLQLGQSVTFDITLEAITCPADRSQWKKTFKIYPVGLTEKLVVNIELVCECECEKPQFVAKNSPSCSGSGSSVCGACLCNDGRFGDSCECDESTIGSEDHLALCKRSNTSEVCEGRGQCLCGKCACNQISTVGDQSSRFSGKYCECNDYSCDYHNAMLCGGPEHGECQCGLCACKPAWTGPVCHCSTLTKDCRAANGKICNDKGNCVCGTCVCDPTSGYQGATCEQCPLCKGYCDAHRPCVECSTFQNYDNIPQELCSTNCTHVTTINKFNETEHDDEIWKVCGFRIKNCDATFRYHLKENRIEALSTKECQAPVNPIPIIIGVIIGVIVLGILLLVVWKVIVTIKDRREYARFEKARENAKWDAGENPIYKQATTTYKNPHYAKSE